MVISRFLSIVSRTMSIVSRFGLPPPPCLIGLPVGGGRLDPQNRRFQDRFLKHKKLRTSGSVVAATTWHGKKSAYKHRKSDYKHRKLGYT